MINVVIASPFRERFANQIKEIGAGTCSFSELPYDASPEQACGILENAEVIIGYIMPQFLQYAGKLRWMQLTWAGVDPVRGKIPDNVTVTNVSGAFGKIISEHIMSFVLALGHGLPGYIRQAKWKTLGSEVTLEGKTALILGAGDIGRSTAEKLKVFDCRTVGIRRVARNKPACFDEMYTMEELDTQLDRADVVICCLPGTEQTNGLLNERRIGLMKRGAMLINVGRGTLIDTQALIAALREGRIFGAALDVTSPEPLPEDSPLWQMDNVIITPHVAGLGFGHCEETEAKICDICCENLKRYIEGSQLVNLVDMKLGYRKTVM